jgi:hypothetical protein
MICGTAHAVCRASRDKEQAVRRVTHTPGRGGRCLGYTTSLHDTQRRSMISQLHRIARTASHTVALRMGLAPRVTYMAGASVVGLVRYPRAAFNRGQTTRTSATLPDALGAGQQYRTCVCGERNRDHYWSRNRQVVCPHPETTVLQSGKGRRLSAPTHSARHGGSTRPQLTDASRTYHSRVCITSYTTWAFRPEG